VAEVERVLEARVGVEAREEDVGAAVEEALRPVAVVIVDVEERDARRARRSSASAATAALFRKQ
jgi:hypothetical protein